MESNSRSANERAWAVHVELSGNEPGALPVFLCKAVMYVTAVSAKEACWLAERYLKSFQPMAVVSVKPWLIPPDYEKDSEDLYEQAIEAMRRYAETKGDENKVVERMKASEQTNSGSSETDPIGEDLRGEQRFESGDTYSGDNS